MDYFYKDPRKLIIIKSEINMATKNPQYLKEWQFPAEFEQLISSWNAKTQIEILGYVTKANKHNLNRNVEYSKTYLGKNDYCSW